MTALLLFASLTLSACSSPCGAIVPARALTPALAQQAAGGFGAQEEVPLPEAGELELSDEHLPSYRSRLLEMAFQAASVLPNRPHIKNKARFQEEVLESFLELGQLQAVQSRLEQVPNWRRGTLYGKLAVAILERGVEGDVAPLLEEAEAISRGKLGELGQDWRRDEILVEVAHARVLSGRADALSELDGKVEPAQRPQLEAIRARMLKEEDLESHIEFLQALMAGGQGQFEDVQAGLEAMAELVLRFYDQEEVRERLLVVLQESWKKMPVGIQFDMHVRLGRAAATAGDSQAAAYWADKAEEFIGLYKWLEQDYVKVRSDVAVLRFESGAEAAGIAIADEAFAFYRENREKITNMFRGDGLRPLAQAYAEMEQFDTATAVYKVALEEALVNPNPRPRCHDLARTLTSLAMYDLEPSEALWAEIGKVYAAIGAPGLVD